MDVVLAETWCVGEGPRSVDKLVNVKTTGLALHILALCWLIGCSERKNEHSERTRWANQAAQALSNLDYDTAVKNYTELLNEASDRDKAELLFARAMAYAGLGSNELAFIDVGQAIQCEAEPKALARLHLARTALCLLKCDSKSAFIDAESAVKLDPANWETYRARATLKWYFHGQYDSAMSDFKVAIQLALQAGTANGTNNASWGYCRRAEALSDLGEYEKALEDFRSAIALAPSTDAVVGAARAYVAVGKWDAAIELMDKMLVERPSDVHALGIRGWAVMSNGQMAEARTCFEKARDEFGLALLDFASGSEDAALARITPENQGTCEDLRSQMGNRALLLYACGKKAEAKALLVKRMSWRCLPNLAWSLCFLDSERTPVSAGMVNELETKLMGFPGSIWTKHLVLYALGTESLEQALAVNTAVVSGLNNQRLAELHLVAGERLLNEKQVPLAVEHFRIAATNSLRHTIVYLLSKKRLDQIPHLSRQ